MAIDGTQHNLGPDRDEATRQYHQLMAQPRAKKVLANSVPAVVDAFLDWCQNPFGLYSGTYPQASTLARLNAGRWAQIIH